MSWETTELFFPIPLIAQLNNMQTMLLINIQSTITSPESRIILQQDAGEAWKKNPVLIHYLTNESNTVLNCIRYQVNDKGTLYEDGVYDPGELRVIQSTDEDGKSSYTFTDKEDRTVLIREMDGTKQHDTHYVYDIKGNLCYVLSPMYQESQGLKFVCLSV